MEPEDPGGGAALRWPDPGWPDPAPLDAAWTRPGLDDAGPDSAGPDSAGPDSAGQDTAGPDSAGQDTAGQDSAGTAVGALYQAHAVSLIRLAYIMLGDRPAAEDVVQDAFCGLYRRWDRLSDPTVGLYYVRSSVLNGCRTVLRRRALGRRVTLYQPPARSAEAAALSNEERQEVMRAVRALPGRQREALVLRFYLDLPDREIARAMGVRPGTVRSATHRALRALSKLLGETP
jgi:RNA polymerase sigma-70 factor (sigma-E family)